MPAAVFGLSKRFYLGVCVVLILAGIFLAGMFLTARYNFDAEHRKVAVVLDGTDLDELASVYGRDRVRNWLQQADFWGIALSELSLREARLAGYVTTKSDGFTQRRAPLLERSDGCRVWRRRSVSVAAGTHDEIPWGFSPDQRWLHRFPANHMLRVQNSPAYSDACLRESAELAARGDISIFTGEQVLGSPGRLGIVAEEIRTTGAKFGRVEFGEQTGADRLAARLGTQSLMVHSISDAEMLDYSLGAAVDRMTKAARERTVRVLYLNLFRPDTGGAGERPSLELNRKYLNRLNSKLRSAGFQPVGKQETFSFPVEELALEAPGEQGMRIALGLAALGFFLWAVQLIFPLGRAWRTLLMFGAIGGGTIGAVFFTWPVLKLAALLAGLSVPIAAVLTGTHWLHRREKSGWGSALSAFLMINAVTVVGGLLIYALFSSPLALVKLRGFSGVTLTLLFPVFVLTANFWNLGEYSSRETVATRLEDLFQKPVDYGALALIFLILGALALVTIRSGNQGDALATSLELQFRNLMEELLPVRPRNKELLGQPMFFLAAALWRKRPTWSLLGIVGMAVAQVSVLNTLLHVHTELRVSLMRIGEGVAWGVLVGIPVYLIASGLSGD